MNSCFMRADVDLFFSISFQFFSFVFFSFVPISTVKIINRYHSDLDLDPLTMVLILDLDVVEIYQNIKNEVFESWY